MLKKACQKQLINTLDHLAATKRELLINATKQLDAGMINREDYNKIHRHVKKEVNRVHVAMKLLGDYNLIF